MKILPVLLLGLVPALADAPDRPATWRVRQTTTLDGIAPAARVVRWWIPIPDDTRLQQILDLRVVDAPGPWKVVRDRDRANRFLYVELRDPGVPELQLTCEFTVRRDPARVVIDPARVGPLDPALFAASLRPDAPHMAVTEDIAARADEVCGDERNLARQARLLLDHVADTADHYSKDPSKPSCGVGDAGACLEQGGGCCTDLHSLFIALARARGIPARLQMGYRLLRRNAGKEIDPGYRCWVEYFLPGHGWVPADIVEADAPDGAGRDRWFSGLTEERVWLNSGREFRLSTAPKHGPVNHMSHGWAEIDGVPARLLPDGERPPQITRRVRFTEAGDDR